MLRYMRAILDEGTIEGSGVFLPGVAQAIRTPMTAFPPEVGNWNAGFWDMRLPGGFHNIGHDGGTLSFFAVMVLVPELRLGIFVATNTEGGGRLTAALPARIVQHF